MFPELKFWFEGLVWVPAVTALIAGIVFCTEAREIFSENSFSFFKFTLSAALLICAFLAWWAAAVQQEQQAPRYLNKAQESKLVSILSDSAKFNPSIIVFSAKTSPDAKDYANQWAEVFRKSGWKVRDAEGLIMGTGKGMIIQVKNINAPGAGDLQRAISEIGLKSKAESTDDSEMEEGEVKLIIGAKEE